MSMLKNSKILALIIAQLGNRKSSIAYAGILIIILSFLVLPSPLIIKTIIDTCLPQNNITLLFTLVAAIIGVHLIHIFLEYKTSLFFCQLNENIILELKSSLLEKVHTSPLKNTSFMGRGYLFSIIDQDLNQVRLFFADSVFSLARALLTFIVGCVALYTISPLLTGLSFLALPLYYALVVYYSKRTGAASEDFLERRAKSTNALQESLSSISTSKSCSNSHFPIHYFYTHAKASVTSFINLQKIVEQSSSLLGSYGSIYPALIFGLGAYLILKESFTLGSLLAFSQFSGYLFGPVHKVLALKIELAKAQTAMQRLDGLLDLPEDQPPVASTTIDSLVYQNIRFSYDGENLFKDLTITAKKGDVIGITGPSGAGKTTLGRILTGLIAADQGSFSINASHFQNCQEFPSFRNHCIFIEQDPFFFDTTVAENVAFQPLHHLDTRKVNACLSEASATFVEMLERGSMAQVGVNGNQLSAGQRQRLGIARGLYMDSEIMVLDEPTANLDGNNTAAIIQLIKHLAKNRILFVITHDPVVSNCFTATINLSRAA